MTQPYPMTNSHFALDLPVNSVSFGQCSTAILREVYSRGLHPAVFPVGNQVDLSTQKPDPAFNAWLTTCANNAQQKHSRKHPAIKLWHLNGGLPSVSERGNDLITFFELDQITPTEINVLKQQHRVYVTSRFTQGVFGQFGIKAEYLPIGFDAFNFASLPVRPRIEGVTQFLLGGKAERRKSSYQVLAAWVKRYGNQKAYKLNCAITNPFLKQDDQNALIAQALGGKQYWNINWLPYAGTNAEYNAVLQSSEIVISCSGGEGRDLPCYQATALGAWPVALRAHAYLDYLDDANAVLISPNGKAPAADGVFFHPGQPFNQGNWFTASDDDLIAGFEAAEARAKTGINTAGLALQKLTYKDTVDVLLTNLHS